ncbi:MAG: hypothetical protein R2774_03825 [Saprospiraceae bacterium]
MRSFLFIFTFLLFFGIDSTIYAQCGIKEQVILNDFENNQADTTNILLNISGASVNDLGHPIQCLQFVEIEFSHPFVKELWFELLSPSGQTVQLTGGNITAYNSDFVKWNVGFEQCAVSVSPDPGFYDIWDNDQDWLGFTTYSGTYYPYNGCLEDFNTGPVNGTWTLRCIDFQDFGQGKVTKFNLNFCNGSGIKCGECTLDPGDIMNDDFSACEGSSSLNIILDKVHPKYQPNFTSYNYENVVFSDGKIYSYSTTTNFQSLPAGTYTICGLQFTDSNKADLPVEGQPYDANSLQSFFESKGYCAAVSSSCMTVTIDENSEPTKVTEVICNGETLTFAGNQYSLEGEYEIRIPNGHCDSVVILDLRVAKLVGELQSDRDTVGCFANTNALWITNTGDPLNNIQISWYSPNSVFISDPAIPDFIDVRDPGIYCGVLESNIGSKVCRDTVCKEIFPDQTIPQLNFKTDTITCKKSVISLEVGSSRTLVDYKWTDPNNQPISDNSATISVSIPGRYTLSATADNGCVQVDSVLVPENRIIPTATILSDTLFCFEDSIKLKVLLPVGAAYNFLWSGVKPQNENVQEPFVTSGGVKMLTITDTINGCEAAIAHTVIEEREKPTIDIIVDKINCAKESVTPTLNSNHPIEKYQWIGNGLNSSHPTPTITNQGTYFVTITSSKNGCTSNTSFFVEKDTIVPVLSIRSDSLTCLVDSIKIITTSTVSLLETNWSGPFGFSSDEIDPFVKNKGIYTISFVSENGCSGTQQYLVSNSVDIPQAIFKLDTLWCNDTIADGHLLLSKGTYTYRWDGPNVQDANTSTPKFFEPGRYVVTITNPISGCIEEDEYSVADMRIYPNADIDLPILDCVKDSVQIVFNNDDLLEIRINGPESFESSILNPFVKIAGVYDYSITNILFCTTTGTFEVIQNDEVPVISVVLDTLTCSQPQIVIDANSSIPNSTFAWTDVQGGTHTGPSLPISEGGTYQLIGTAPNQCKGYYTFQIIEDTIKPQIQVVAPEAITCTNNGVVLKVTSNDNSVQLHWTNVSGADSLVVNSSGLYTALGIGKNGCTSTMSVAVMDQRIYPEAAYTASIINCKDTISNIELTSVSPWESIEWNNGKNPLSIPNGITKFNTKIGGLYEFTLTNDDGCITKDTVEVVEDLVVPNVLQIYSDTIDCNHDMVNIGIKDDVRAIEYIWNGPDLENFKGDSIISVALPGQYALQIVGENFCSTTQNFNVIQSKDLPIYQKYSDTLTCENGKVKIGIIPSTPVATYFWNGPSGLSNAKDPIVFEPGIHYVTITGINGCSVKDSVDVFINVKKPSITIPDTILLPCDTSAINFVVQTSDHILRYRWRLPDDTYILDSLMSSNQLGTYTVQVTGANGCISNIHEFRVFVDSVPPAFTYQTDTITCFTPSITLSASSTDLQAIYQWTTPSGTQYSTRDIVTQTPGEYQLVVSNLQKCRDTIDIFVPADTLRPNILVDQIGSVVCKNGMVTLKASTDSNGIPLIFNWTTQNGEIISGSDSPNLMVNGAGNYSLNTINTINGCNSTNDISVESVPQTFNQISTTEFEPFCSNIFDGRIHIDSLNGTPPYIITFNSHVTNTTNFNNLAPGIYTIEVEDVNGCIVMKTVDLQNIFNFNLDIDTEYTINFGDSVLLKPSYTIDPTGTVQLKWFENDSLICTGCPELWVAPLKNTIYKIEYAYNAHCGEEALVHIKVSNQITDAIPNIFRPTSISGNEVFYIPQTRGIERILGMYIFDAWAENVFSIENVPSGDPIYGWNGTFNGDHCAEGTYVVIIKLLLVDGTTWEYQTTLTLLR